MSLNLIKLYQKQSSWYKGTTTGVPVGICFHDTGCNNNTLKRYVQPNDDDANRAEMLAKIGTNYNKNDWNHKAVSAGVNAWIGLLADGSIATVQAGPWNYRPWGVGSGSNGSLNGDKRDPKTPFWIQFEICEDDRKSKTYFEKAYNEAIGLSAYLCKMYGFDPHGTVSYKGKTVPVITCHRESAALGLGSGHSDVLDWFPLYGKSMDDVRNDIAAAMGSVSSTEPEVPAETTPTAPVDGTIRVGSLVSIKPGSKYYSGSTIPSWVLKLNWYVHSAPEGSDRVVINESEDRTHKIMSSIHRDNLTVVGSTSTESSTTKTPETTGYKVKILHGAVETKGTWCKLKSGKGWSSLGYCKKL